MRVSPSSTPTISFAQLLARAQCGAPSSRLRGRHSRRQCRVPIRADRGWQRDHGAHAGHAIRGAPAGTGLHNVRNALAACAVAHALRIAPAAVARGLGSSSRVRRAGCSASAVAAAACSSMTPTTPIRTRCERPSRCSPRHPAAGSSCSVTWVNWETSGRSLHAADRRRRPSRQASTRLLTLGELSAAAATSLRSQAPATSAISRRCATRSKGCSVQNVTVLVKGSRFMRMERVVWQFVDGEPAHAGAGRALTCCSSWPSGLRTDVRAFNVFNYITLRAVLATLTSLVISFIVGPTMIRKLTAYKIGQAVRDDGPQSHLVQSRHADHGRCADPGVGRGHHAAVGRPVESLRLGRAARDAGLRHRRLGRRLPQGRAPQSQGSAGAHEVLLAIGDRTGGGDLPRLQRDAPAQTEFIVPFFKQVSYPLGMCGLRGDDLLRDRRHQQRGEPDRWSRRPGDHAHRDGGQRARRVRLRRGPRGVLQVPGLSAHPGRRRAHRVLRGTGRCRARVPVVQRLPGGGVHGRRRRAGARRGAGHHRGDRAGRRSCCSSWAGCSWSRRCR